MNYWGDKMKPRKQPYGDKNISGEIIEKLRKEKSIKQHELVSRMQILGVDINPSSLSKLEGQQRIATDIELRAIAHILNVSMDVLVPPLD